MEMNDSRRAFLERQLETCELAWKAGNFPALIDALIYCAQSNRPLPPWVTSATYKILLEHFEGDRKPRRERVLDPYLRFKHNHIHYSRYDAVEELRDRKAELARLGYKPTWEEAYKNASKILEQTDAAGSPDTVETSYKLVARRMKQGHGAVYYIPRFWKPPRKWGKKRR